MTKGLGTSLLVIGIVLAVGGVGAVVFSEVDEGEEGGWFSNADEERDDRNQQIRTAGWIGTVIGGLLALLGIVAMLARRI